MKIYAVSDIHGNIEAFNECLDYIDIDTNDNLLILLGDYVDNGYYSKEILLKVMDLEKKYPENIITLLGNHDEDFYYWLHNIYEYYEINNETAQSFFTDNEIVNSYNNNLALQTLFKNKYPNIVTWFNKKINEKRYFESEHAIYVHAGISEPEGDENEQKDFWKLFTSEDTYTHKYPATTGKFFKDIISGHIYSYEVAENESYFGKIYYDGLSHYFIDGHTSKSNKIPILMYDTETKTYTFLNELGG